MNKFEFELTIKWNYSDRQEIKIKKILNGKNHNSVFLRAEKWAENQVLICGKDAQQRDYTEWKLKFIKNSH